jgi:hypothetical protein
VCGAENALARTFCQVCGSTLARAGPPPASPPPMPASPPGEPVPTLASAPQPPGRATSAGAAGAAAGSRGGGGWIVILAVLGLLAGIGFVLVPSLLGSRPATEAVPSRALPTGLLPEASSAAGVTIALAGRLGARSGPA